MKKLLAFIIFTFGTVLNVQAEELNFGTPINTDAKIKISSLLANAQDYLAQEVTVEGMVVGVCSKRGCWVELASDARFEKLRIKVRDGDMVFPMHAKGRQALATGSLQEIKLSLEQTKQYKASIAKRLGESIDVDTITEPMSIYQLSPTGVKILE